MTIQIKHFKLVSTYLFLTLVSFQATYAYGQATLLSNARIIIGDGTVIEQGSILIVDGVIASVTAADLTANSNMQQINVQGKTIMPALIDAHAHLGFQNSSHWQAENYTNSNIISNLEQYAYYGFAAVFSAGTDPIEIAQAIQAQQTNDQLGGARLLYAVGMGPSNQGPNDLFLKQIAQVEARLNVQVLRGLTSTIDGINAAREVEALGVPFIKLWIDDRGGSQHKLHPDIYKPLIAEAQRLRIKTFIHQQYTADMFEQISSGAAGFLHGRLEQEFSRELAKLSHLHQVFIVPNLGLAELRRLPIGADPFLQTVLTEDLQNQLTYREPLTENEHQARLALEQKLQSTFKMLIEEQVDVVLGTDAGAVPNHPFGYTGHKELEIYVRLGFSPMQAIMAGTSIAAKHLGLDNLGSLKVGNSADLVVLTENPLSSISNTQTIEKVFIKGKLIDRDSIAQKLRNP